MHRMRAALAVAALSLALGGLPAPVQGAEYEAVTVTGVVLTAPDDTPRFDSFACAPQIRVPTLFAMSPDDEKPGAASDVTRAVFDLIPGPKELVEVDGGHFGIIEFPSPAFDRASQAQASFLARALGVTL